MDKKKKNRVYYRPEWPDLVKMWRREDNTLEIKQIALLLGCSQGYIYECREKYSDFDEAFYTTREIQISQLEASYLKLGMGYEVTETETRVQAGADGAPQVKEQMTRKRHIAANEAAARFALMNLAPQRWVAESRIVLTGDPNGAPIHFDLANTSTETIEAALKAFEQILSDAKSER